MGGTMPEIFRISPPRIARPRTEVAISEIRVTTSWITDRTWGATPERERGIALGELIFAVPGKQLIRCWTPRVNISLHALGRWFERSGEREHTALIRDLAMLAQADEKAERVETPGGFWLGQVIDAMDDGAGKGVKMRNVRTWIAA
jgi:hypothetical protein